jgi:hypothetical protein
MGVRVDLPDTSSLSEDERVAWFAGYFLGRRDALKSFPGLLEGEESERVRQALSLAVEKGVRPPSALMPMWREAVQKMEVA